jgi:PIN domain nuclease of toxin-antitoxin system
VIVLNTHVLVSARADERRLDRKARTFLERRWKTGEVAVRAVGLGGLPNDPADRLIIATALQHGAALVTADERLLAWSYPMVRHDARR